MRLRLIEYIAIVIGVVAVVVTLPLLPVIWLWAVIAERVSVSKQTKQQQENQ